MENVDTQRGGKSAGPLEGTVVAGRYRLAQVLSSGANTVIMDAIDVQTDSPVTVKVVRPEHAQDPEFRRKFRRLAEISNALTHPNIASVTDWGEIELRGASTVFWTVDALGGGSLRDLLDRGRLLEPGQALVFGLEACRALDAAHHKGLYHTELTPSKMVFGVDRRLRVVDFGMARLLAEPAWADAATVPTHVARYASPEQALGLPIDAKTDVYALALVMIEAVTGSVPFAADSTVSTLAGRVDKLLPVSADLGALASVLERAGRPESADRFTAAEFGRALVQSAPRLAKPDPIPILASGTFDTQAMRRPTDPTGGVERPAPVAGLAGVDETGRRERAAVAAAAAAAAAPSDVEADDVADEPVAPALESDGAPTGAVTTEDESVDVASSGDAPVDGAPDHDVPDDDGLIDDASSDDVSDDDAPDDDASDDDAPGDDQPDDGAPDDDAPAGNVAPAGAVAAGEGIGPDDAATVANPTITAADTSVEPGDGDAVDQGGTVDDAGSDDALADSAPDGAAPDAAVVESDVSDEADQGGELSSAEGVAGSATLAALHAELDAEAGPTSGSGGSGTSTATATAVLPRTEPKPSAAPVADDGPGGLFDDEPSRRRGPIVAVVLVLLLGLGALGYAGSLLFQTKSFTVPALAGVTEDEALDQIAGNDWDLETVRERSDSFPEPDTVIRTIPAAGVELDEGEPFTLVLSDGPEFRTLPELDELPYNTAVTELAELGLIGTEADEREFSETVPAEAVVTWRVEGDVAGDMQAGAQILPGETVVMVLSNGPEPRTIPDLTGGTGPEGRTTIEGMQLEYVREADVFSDTVPAGQVVTQTPAAGETLERGGTVTVQVSKGPDVVAFPDLEGLAFGAARDLLVETGFTIGSLLGSTEGTFVEGTIDGTDVPVGEVLPRGTPVDLIFL